MEDKVVAVAVDLLPTAKQQPEESVKYSALQNTSQFGVVQRKCVGPWGGGAGAGRVFVVAVLQLLGVFGRSHGFCCCHLLT